MNKLAKQLIGLGNAKPELLKHLRPILGKVANTKAANNPVWEREFDNYLEWLDNDRQRWRVDLSLGDFVPGSSQRRYERILDLLEKGWTVGTEDGGMVLKSRGEGPNVPLNLVEADFVKYLLY